MAEVMAASTATTGSASLSKDSPEPSYLATRPVFAHRSHSSRDHIPTYAESRMSSYSRQSRPQSNTFPTLQSSLSYASVRDFAYPNYHPLHFGAPPEESGTSTPNSEWNAGRRMSDSAEGSTGTGRGTWIAGPWGGDGAMYGDPDHDMEPLPSTSFGSVEDWREDEATYKKSKHRKSRSFADVPDYERGRRRESGHGQSSDFDPAGRDALRQSRGGLMENGEVGRRDSHVATGSTLPSRSYHTSQPINPDEDIPLDAEPSTHSPQRESIGPEDEELFAGPSLALYSFEPENDNELRLTEGQTILVSYRHGQGWLVAENPQTGEQGLVPEQYVRLLRDIDGWDEERGGFIDDEDLMDTNDEVSEQSPDLPTPQPSDLDKVPDTTLPAGHDLDCNLDMKNLSMQER